MHFPNSELTQVAGVVVTEPRLARPHPSQMILGYIGAVAIASAAYLLSDVADDWLHGKLADFESATGHNILQKIFDFLIVQSIFLIACFFITLLVAVFPATILIFISNKFRLVNPIWFVILGVIAAAALLPAYAQLGDILLGSDEDNSFPSSRIWGVAPLMLVSGATGGIAYWLVARRTAWAQGRSGSEEQTPSTP